MTTSVKTTDAVCPEEPTVITGIYVPTMVLGIAIRVSRPEGFDSDSL